MPTAATTTVTTVNTTYWPLYDANGNVSEYLAASDNSIAAHYEYDPFGNTTLASGPHAADFAHRFSTKFLDAETGLYYYGVRYLDTETGRWIGRDPLGEVVATSLYRYARNNTVFRYDIIGAVDVSGVFPHDEGLLTVTKQTSLNVQGQIRINGFFAPPNMRDSLYSAKTRMVRCSCVGPLPLPNGFKGYLLRYKIRIDMTSEVKSDVDVPTMLGRYGHEQRHAQNFLNVIFKQMVPRMEEWEMAFLPCCPSEEWIRHIEDEWIRFFAPQINIEESHSGPPFYGHTTLPFPPVPQTSLGILAYLYSSP